VFFQNLLPKMFSRGVLAAI